MFDKTQINPREKLTILSEVALILFYVCIKSEAVLTVVIAEDFGVLKVFSCLVRKKKMTRRNE